LKVLLDTSYIFPFLGIEIENISNEQLYAIFSSEEHEFYYVDVSIFELVAKIIKVFISSDEDKESSLLKIAKKAGFSLSDEYDLNYFNEKLDSLLHFDNPKRLIWYFNPLINDLLCELRKIHTDFFDCIILFTAVIYCDCLATMDITLVDKIQGNGQILNLIKKYNPNFCLWMKDLKDAPIKLIFPT
jgi:hypothetical protein